MPKLRIPGGALAALLVPAGLWAGPPTQEPAAEAKDTRIQTMQVEIWPEYDDPRVLVMYRGTMAADQALPTDFAFIVPSDAQVHMAGALDANGGHLHALFQEKDRGDGTKEIFYSLEHPEFYMEFYYDPLTGDEQRAFRYPLVSPFSIEDLRISVQQPLRATGFGVTPATTNVMQDQKGLTYYTLSMGRVPAGEERSVSVAYRKPDREPSVRAKQAGGEVPESQGRAMKGILVGAGILLLAVVGYGLFVSSRRKGARTASHAGRSDPAHPVQTRRGFSRFCTQCGAEIDSTTKFCGSCGHRVAGLA